MEFRKVTAIVRPDSLEPVERALQALGVPGVSVTRGKGYGEYADFYTPDWMLTHARVEVFVGQHRADEVARAIVDAAHTGLEGDGIVAVLPVESVYHIRTREKCEHDVCE
jgi:nitrogen regulatory protein P-II 1